MSMEFMRNALFGKLPHSSPVTVVGGEDVRASLAARIGCKPEDIERELQRILGKPETFKPTPKEMQELLDRDQARDANAPHLRIRAAKKEAACQERGAEGRGTDPGPATRNDSTKDGNESSERNENV